MGTSTLLRLDHDFERLAKVLLNEHLELFQNEDLSLDQGECHFVLSLAEPEELPWNRNLNLLVFTIHLVFRWLDHNIVTNLVPVDRD